MSNYSTKINRYTFVLILISFCLSLIISKYNLFKYDKINEFEGKNYHQMLKHDPLRYMGHGSEIKESLSNGDNFFNTGRENYTKYLPPRLAAIFFLIFDENIYDEKTSQIKTGIYFPYLFSQCLIYFLSILFIFTILKKKYDQKITFFMVLFLSLEPTIFQYHGTFWSESIFFSLQIFILGFFLKENKNIYTFFLIGLLIGLLSLQKQYAVFIFFPVIFYILIFEINNKVLKSSFLLVGFLILQLFLGFNNYVRSGSFYIITADMKHGAHMDLISKVMSKKMNITKDEFNIIEGEAAKDWAISENIILIENQNKSMDIYEFRKRVANEKDKVKLDNFLAERSINYLFDNLYDFSKFILKKSLHTTLLNPFHIYSDHKFNSGEYYYTTETHKKLLPIRVIYTSIIYILCFIGLIDLYKKKKYKEIILFVTFFLYFYGFVSWHGNTRYFVPCLIYLSIFFSFGSVKLISILQKKNSRNNII